MNPEAFLTTTAEVGIAIAGFSGIAAVLGRRAEGGWSPLDAFRMRLLLQSSFAAVVFSLLPIVLFSAGLREGVAWTTASALYFAFLAIAVARTLFKERGALTQARDVADRGYLVFFVSAPLVHLGLHLLNVSVLRTAWPYLLGLLINLSVAFSQFVRLLRGLWRTSGGAA